MGKKALLVTRVSGFVPQFEMNNVRILQEMGYEIHYAANYNTVVYGRDNSRLMETGIKRHHIPFGRSPFSPDVWKCYNSLKRLMLVENFDLIHCHMPMTGILTRKAAEKVRKLTGRKVPVLYTAHGFHFYKGAPMGNWFYYLPERHYAKYTDKLILINEEDVKRGEKFQVRGSVEYIPGVGAREMPPADPDFNLRETYGIPEGNKVVLSVGELTVLKNHETVIKALDRFRREPVSYLICGDGERKKELETMVRHMHLEHKVVFAGYCSNIPDILRQSDIFAFPSQREGLSMAMMEAMQAGLPILAADIRGNHDLTVDGEGGFLFDENLPEDYVKGIRYFLKYPDEAARMGEWNTERVKAFSLDVTDKRMREIYRDVCGEEQADE